MTATTTNSPILKTIANIIAVNLLATSSKLQLPINELISPEDIWDLARLFEDKKINNQGLSKAIDILIQNPDKTVDQVVREEGLLQISSDDILLPFVVLVIQNNVAVVEEYKAGKIQVLGFLVGQCMKESRGKGNPQRFGELLEIELAK